MKAMAATQTKTQGRISQPASITLDAVTVQRLEAIRAVEGWAPETTLAELVEELVLESYRGSLANSAIG